MSQFEIGNFGHCAGAFMWSTSINMGGQVGVSLCRAKQKSLNLLRAIYKIKHQELLKKRLFEQHNWQKIHYTSLWHFIHMHILYRPTHTNTGPLDTLHEFSTTVKGKNRGMKERKMTDGGYDMKQNMCSFLLTARTSSL